MPGRRRGAVRCRRSRLCLSLLGVRRSRSAGGVKTVGCVVQRPESPKIHWLTFLATSAAHAGGIHNSRGVAEASRGALPSRWPVWVTAQVLPTAQPPFSMGHELPVVLGSPCAIDD